MNPSPRFRPELVLALFFVGACNISPTAIERRPDVSLEEAPLGDPSVGEVPLEAGDGWEARLIWDAGVGVWAVKSFPVFEQYAVPEVVAMDDRGRCAVLISYSGKFTPKPTVHDAKWLAPATFADIDPRLDGPELYVSGQGGNIYQVKGYRHGALDSRLIAHLPGLEVHTLVAGELDGNRSDVELLAFTRPGALYRLTPSVEGVGFELVKLQDLPGRVRDALVLPTPQGTIPRIATASRAGEITLLQLTDRGPTWETIHQLSMGFGRLALRPAELGENIVLYSSCDDGRVLRHEELPSGEWITETIFDGPQGPRGLAAGRFHADPQLECVAIHGYSGKVQLLTRAGDSWSVETIFTDVDKGHWLEVAELDGRNGTDELICSGYSGRVVLLQRPPGFAR